MANQKAILSYALDIVRKRIRQVRERKELIGEQNTKATLIEPVLTALGWNLQEIDEVRREYKRKPQDNPVDYALFLNRTECLFVEAKSLDKDLSDHKWVTQNLTYATGAGVQWCLLTNGDEYRIYNAHAPVPAEERLFRSVRVSESDSKLLIDTLALLSKQMMRGSLLDELWKAHFVDRNVRLAIESLLAEEDTGLVRVIQKKAGALTPPDIRASLKRAKIQIDFPVPAALPSSDELEPRSDTLKDKSATLANLIEAGLIRPPLEVEREYKGVRLTAVIQQGGEVLFAGEAYDSLSTAGGMARKTVIGAPKGRPYPQTSGWQFWQYRDENGELQEVDQLRRRYLGRAPGTSA